jgi:hypothetical protein
MIYAPRTLSGKHALSTRLRWRTSLEDGGFHCPPGTRLALIAMLDVVRQKGSKVIQWSISWQSHIYRSMMLKPAETELCELL